MGGKKKTIWSWYTNYNYGLPGRFESADWLAGGASANFSGDTLGITSVDVSPYSCNMEL